MPLQPAEELRHPAVNVFSQTQRQERVCDLNSGVTASHFLPWPPDTSFPASEGNCLVTKSEALVPIRWVENKAI